MAIVNRTPHPITIITPGTDEEIVIERGSRSDQARVMQRSGDMGPTIEDPRVHELSGGWGRIVGLDRPRDGVLQVVSVHVVLAAVAAGRTLRDLAIPGGQRRNDQGQIVASEGITRASDAFPRAHWQRLPRVAIFGSAARWLIERWAGTPGRVGAVNPTWRPGDIDVAYCGMDPDAAAGLVEGWLRDGGGKALLEACGVLPFDLHSLGDGHSTLCIPRPAALQGEAGDVPLDDAVVAVFGGDEDEITAFNELRTIPAILRRAATLIAAGQDPRVVAAQVGDSWPWRADILIGEGGDRAGAYTSSSTAAIRRALTKFEPNAGLALVDKLRDLGLPIDAVLTVALGEVHPDALRELDRGAPPAAGGPILRIQADGGRWLIGPVHGAACLGSNAEATCWLRGTTEPTLANMVGDVVRGLWG